MTASVAIVGAGVMGSLHAHTAVRSKGLARVSVVIDSDIARAKMLASDVGADSVSDSIDAVDRELGACDLAIVATPTQHHCEATLALLDLGLNVLVEKPMAPTVDEARMMQDRAKQLGLVLSVGHVERFNPAAIELPRLIEDPVFIETRRLSPLDADRTHDSVIFDLMLHDLDLIRQLDSSAVRYAAGVASATHSTSHDLATCTLELESGLICQLTASRISQRKTRTVQVTMSNGVLDADLLMRTIQVARDTTSELIEHGPRRLRQHTVTEIPWLAHGGEPLGAQLEDVLASIRDGRKPTVTPSDGVAAVDLCSIVHAAVESRHGTYVESGS